MRLDSDGNVFFQTICSCKSFNFPCGSKHDLTSCQNYLQEKSWYQVCWCLKTKELLFCDFIIWIHLEKLLFIKLIYTLYELILTKRWYKWIMALIYLFGCKLFFINSALLQHFHDISNLFSLTASESHYSCCYCLKSWCWLFLCLISIWLLTFYHF
jgi:hypothetical protein